MPWSREASFSLRTIEMLFSVIDDHRAYGLIAASSFWLNLKKSTIFLHGNNFRPVITCPNGTNVPPLRPISKLGPYPSVPRRYYLSGRNKPQQKVSETGSVQKKGNKKQIEIALNFESGLNWLLRTGWINYRSKELIIIFDWTLAILKETYTLWGKKRSSTFYTVRWFLYKEKTAGRTFISYKLVF